MSKLMLLFVIGYSIYTGMIWWEHFTSHATIGWSLTFWLIPLMFFLWGYFA